MGKEKACPYVAKSVLVLERALGCFFLPCYTLARWVQFWRELRTEVGFWDLLWLLSCEATGSWELSELSPQNQRS